jgi:hypothetical protein
MDGGVDRLGEQVHRLTASKQPIATELFLAACNVILDSVRLVESAQLWPSEQESGSLRSPRQPRSSPQPKPDDRQPQGCIASSSWLGMAGPVKRRDGAEWIFSCMTEPPSALLSQFALIGSRRGRFRIPLRCRRLLGRGGATASPWALLEETRTRARRVMARLASSASGWLHARAADLPNGVQAFSMACAAAVGLPPRTRHRCWDSVPSRCSTRPARWQEGWEECGERWHGWQRTPPGSGESAEAKRRPSAEPVLTTDLASAPLSELPTRDDGTADPTEVWIAESICCRWPSE